MALRSDYRAELWGHYHEGVEVSGMCEIGQEEGFQKEGREGGVVENKEGEGKRHP